jgi:hypothetical protein
MDTLAHQLEQIKDEIEQVRTEEDEQYQQWETLRGKLKELRVKEIMLETLIDNPESDDTELIAYARGLAKHAGIELDTSCSSMLMLLKAFIATQ